MRLLMIIFSLITLNTFGQCSQPLGSAANPNGSNVIITWNKRTCANGYKIRYRPLGTTTWKYKTVPDTNQTTIYFLSYSTDYEFAIASLVGTTPTNYSWTKTFRTLCECLEPIVVIDSIGANRVLFYMDDDSCGVGFRIQYRVVGASAWNTLTVRDTAQTLLSPVLNQNTTYEYRSRRDCKVDGSYASKWNQVWQFTTATALRSVKFKSNIILKSYAVQK